MFKDKKGKLIELILLTMFLFVVSGYIFIMVNSSAIFSHSNSCGYCLSIGIHPDTYSIDSTIGIIGILLLSAIKVFYDCQFNKFKNNLDNIMHIIITWFLYIILTVILWLFYTLGITSFSVFLESIIINEKLLGIYKFGDELLQCIYAIMLFIVLPFWNIVYNFFRFIFKEKRISLNNKSIS